MIINIIPIVKGVEYESIEMDTDRDIDKIVDFSVPPDSFKIDVIE